jgi:hypothetical protein
VSGLEDFEAMIACKIPALIFSSTRRYKNGMLRKLCGEAGSKVLVILNSNLVSILLVTGGKKTKFMTSV